LWNRSTQQTFVLEHPELSFADDGMFSPDGLYIAMLARDPGFPPKQAPVVIQSLDGNALGPQRFVEKFSSLSAFTSTELAWQP
jgi:hypothetical protein